MKIIIDGKKYQPLVLLRDKEALLLLQQTVGKPNKKGLDEVLGGVIKSKFIGYISENGGKLIVKATELFNCRINLRRVYFCEYNGKYWLSLEYGYSQHLEFPRNLKG